MHVTVTGGAKPTYNGVQISSLSHRQRLDLIRRHHQPMQQMTDRHYSCEECGQRWPCVTARLAAWDLADDR